jgi:copper transport protein
VTAAGTQLVGAVIASLLLVSTAGCGGGGASATPSATEAPTTVFGRQARELAVGVATTPRGQAVSVETTVLGQDGAGRSDLGVDVAGKDGRWIRSSGCGSGRYCGEVPVEAGSEVRVRLTRPSGLRSTVSVVLPRRPDPARAASLVRSSAAALRDLTALIIDERLDSGPRYKPLVTEFAYFAPNRLAYSTVGAGAAVVIGDSRWDRAATGSWERSPQDPLQVPAPDWRRVVDPSMLGSGLRNGRPVWRVSFFDPTTPAWFEVEIDKRTKLPLWLSMIASAHFMTHRFSAFNAPLSIMPPT